MRTGSSAETPPIRRNSTPAVAPRRPRDLVFAARWWASAPASGSRVLLPRRTRRPCDHGEAGARGYPPGESAAPLVTLPQTFPQPGRRRGRPGGRKGTVPGARPLLAASLSLWGTRTSPLSPRAHWAASGSVGSLESGAGRTGAPQGAEDSGSAGLGGWAGGSFLYWPLFCQGWKRQLVSLPLPRGYRLLMVPWPFPQHSSPSEAPEGLKITGLLFDLICLG